LIARALISAGVIRFEVPSGVVTAFTLAYIGFYPIDYFYVSQAFIRPLFIWCCLWRW
jgi:hypothetical protein